MEWYIWKKESNLIWHGSIDDEPKWLTHFFGGYTLETIVFILNRVPSKSIEKIPHEIWFGKTPCVLFLKMWGYETYVKNLITNMLGLKLDKYYFMGYPKEIRDYFFYNRSEK
jgi:hypothetical protein